MPGSDTEDRELARNIEAQIVDSALEIAEENGRWSSVRLHQVAERLSISPAEVLDHYRDLDSVADAWFRRGLRAMVAEKPDEFGPRPAWHRLEICVLAFFDALATHRRVTAQMVRGRLHPTHPHHWLPMIFNLSRTIHWLREAARLPAPYGTRRAEIEEIGLTVLFLATFRVWARDDSEGQERTRKFLRRSLRETFS